jgi:hypothetical protein
MGDERAYLAAKYRDFETEELLELYRSGLTELAEEVAASELRARGVVVPSGLEPAVPASSDTYAGDLVPVATYFTPTEAHVLQACLQAADVPAVVADAGIVQANSLLGVAVGGVRVLVPQGFVAQAQEVIDAFNHGDLELGDDADVGQL